jgi:hypothetical protein
VLRHRAVSLRPKRGRARSAVLGWGPRELSGSPLRHLSLIYLREATKFDHWLTGI